MPISDLYMLLQWWGVWLIMGFIGWSIAGKLFASWDDTGYGMAKIIGAGLVAYLVWVVGTLHIAKFSGLTVGVSALVILGLGLIVRKKRTINWRLVIAEELLFLTLLIGWAWIRGHAPDVRDLEKFMDYGFAQSIIKSDYFPPADMWFAGESINYYYFGHLILGMITMVSGLSLDTSFNIMLATIFALCFTMSWTIGRKTLQNMGRPAQVFGGLLIATLLTLGGNLHTIYAFTKGYNYDSNDPPPFWEIVGPGGWDSYWYPNATRFIPYTIHEFPSYSFVVSDIHGHVLSIPLALLAIALIINFFVIGKGPTTFEKIMYGLVAGWLFTTNALDGPIYLTIFTTLLIIKSLNVKNIIITLVVVFGTFAVTILPFAVHFDSFVSGVGVNCPPEILAYKPVTASDDGVRKIGPFVFGTVEKCQRSSVWMFFVLWGFFGVCAIKMMSSKVDWGDKRSLIMLVLCCAGLILFAEVFYFKDIYPQHFRSNTMFKLGYQAFMIMSIVSGTVIVRAMGAWKKNWIFLLLVAPLVYLVLIYPTFSVKSYFGELTVERYQGLDGLTWLTREHADDLAAIYWLRTVTRNSQPVILEASGDSYSDSARISTFTGLPTVAGWMVHEWLWRGDYEPITMRNLEVSEIYEIIDPARARLLVDKYKIKYIVIGNIERKKYPKINENEIAKLGKEVFRSPTTKIIGIN